MKRLFSVVLILACLGLCACKPKEKVNDTINPAFYSGETLIDWIWIYASYEAKSMPG